MLTLSCSAKLIRPTLLRARIASHFSNRSRTVKRGASSAAGGDLKTAALLIIVDAPVSNPRVVQLRDAAVPPPRRHAAGQKATTPSTMNPLNFPPFRISVVGKSRYFWFTNSSLVRTFGVTNQPPPT